ncbi:MAG: glycosyl hydrolase family 25 [Clostridia bacterium]|nr:glycosyl hydrolase family 25 [Clostridia bacterium]
MSNLKGIDVSKYQGTIQWDKVKPNIDFAILRCGFGSDITRQDDVCFERNVAECERLNIPFAVYLYSYATTEQKIDSEIAHTLRLIGSHKPFYVYFDMEDNSTTKLGKAKLTAFAKRFCEGIKAKGFKVGVYANQHWFTNYLDVAELHRSGYSIWCAKYSSAKPNIAAPYDIWQYSSKGRVDGINGNVDMNYMYNDVRNVTVSTPIKKTVSELAQEVLAGKWGNGQERKEKLTQAGYDYNAVQKEVNKLATKTTAPAKKSNEEIAREVVQGKWGNGATRKKKLTNAGYNYSAIQKLVNKMM